jgi:hypothetical protein
MLDGIDIKEERTTWQGMKGTGNLEETRTGEMIDKRQLPRVLQGLRPNPSCLIVGLLF